jgi:bifunctional non-homologous end joining protein LigD
MAGQSASRAKRPPPGHGIDTYRARRDFTATSEPAPRESVATASAPIFVVQKHAARRLHWDFRLEHGGVLWSWAVPKGPSMDPGDKRLAVHVEDHPRDYATFQGRIPEGEYGAGTVETWDRGTWKPVGDPEAGLRDGELKFHLAGERLTGGFVLVRLKPRPKERAENWLLIKEHDDSERAGGDATALENEATLGKTPAKRRAPSREPKSPATGAVPAELPATQAPQLASLAESPPKTPGWISEIKFDGYRLLAVVDHGVVRLMTRNGLDWTRRLPRVAEAVARLEVESALLDGELVALRDDGVSSFADLQAALTTGRDGKLFYYLFDLPHLNGWDLSRCRLDARKALLRGVSDWRGGLRYSDHASDDTGRMRRHACELGLEGIICKRADAPYRAGRGTDWIKLKCQDREEFVVLGWTPPEGSRIGMGALHLGFFDRAGALHYVGGVGTGFSDAELRRLRPLLDGLRAEAPPLLYAGDPPDSSITWVTPKLVVDVQHHGWSGAGRLRHAVFLGEREDKPPAEVVRDVPDPKAPRRPLEPRRTTRIVRASAPQRPKAPAMRPTPAIHRAPDSAATSLEGIRLSHPEKELWPGIAKRDLADYWRAVAEIALPGIAHRPLALVRCPDGIAGPHFFQKHPTQGFPAQIHGGEAEGAPFLALDDAAGLIAATQIGAIELHTWGASEADPLHADRVVFDLDPGEGVAFADIVTAAREVRDRLHEHGLTGFCRTSGGKGLHVVAPLRPQADWPAVRDWCHAFARAMATEHPDRYVDSVPKQKRRGHILVDWLRNGLGSTAVASYSPRAREGAGVAMPLAWRDVGPSLDPAEFTVRSVPARLKQRRRDPWSGFADAARALPAGGA